MKTIYLKSSTKSGLIADIASVIESYDGETEFSNGTIHGHWIGKIPDITGWHANLLVPEEFDDSVFSSLMSNPPTTPVHQFA
jgi:hypothetical protein